MRAGLRETLGLLWCLSLACSSPPKTKLSEVLPARSPLYVAVESEIVGDILGQKLKGPVGLAVDIAGRLVVSDAGNHRIVRFTPELVPNVEKGGYGREEGLFDRPSLMTFDNTLNLLVSDEGNKRLVRLNSQLSYVDEIAFRDEDDLTKFGTASGVAVTGYGEVWVADRQRNQVAIFNNVGDFDRFIGDFGYSGGQLRSPEKLVVDQQGSFIVCDAGNSRLVVYDNYGNFDFEIRAAAFDYPASVAIDGDFLWVADAAANTLICCDRKGKVLFESDPTLIGTRTPLKRPSDVALLPDGRLVVADAGNDRLLVCRIGYDSQ